MKQKFWKNLFQGLSTFGAVMVFEIIGVFFLIASPPHNVLIVTILAMSGLFISFFIIGFYWLFQKVEITETGIKILFLSKTLRHIEWEQIEHHQYSNRFKNHEIKIIVKDEKPLFLDYRKRILELLQLYSSKKSRSNLPLFSCGFPAVRLVGSGADAD